MLRSKRTNGCLIAIGAVTALGVSIPAHGATQIDSTDLGNVNLGSQVAGPQTSNFETPPPPNGTSGTIGQLVDRVFNNNGVYTYTHQVTPSNVNAVSEFNTGFSLEGFNDVAGYDFGDTADAGGNGDANDFNIEFNDDNVAQTLDFNTTPGDTAFFDSGDSITFFFQSDLPPEGMGDYNLTNSESGTAQGFTPVPTPTALSAAMLGLGGLALRRKRHQLKA